VLIGEVTFGIITFLTNFGFCRGVTTLILQVKVTPVAVVQVREEGESAGEDPPHDVLDDDVGAIYPHQPPPPHPLLGHPEDGCGSTTTVREIIALIFPALSAFLYWRI